MSGIWLNHKWADIRSYSASVKGAKAVVRVEIEVADPTHLGFLLEDLARAQVELRRERAAEKPAPPQRRDRPALQSTVPLALPFFPSGNQVVRK